MTDKQPEALRLADALDEIDSGYAFKDCEDAAAELRRLHEVNAELTRLLSDIAAFYPNSWAADRANAALAKAEVK